MKFIHIVLLLTLLAIPCIGLAAGPSQYAGVVADLLNPDKLFDALRRNITVPLWSGQNVEIPNPEQVLEKSSPQLEGINEDIKEETGVDLAKFISWFAKMLKLFFQFIVDILEKLSKALDSNK